MWLRGVFAGGMVLDGVVGMVLDLLRPGAVVDQRVKPLLAEKFTKMTKKSFYCNTFGLNDLQKHRDCSCDDAGTE